VDLTLVIAVAFGGAVVVSIYTAFHPVPPKYSNIRLLSGIVAEGTALCLFAVLFRRQGRQLRNLGFAFRWTDLPKALGLALAVLVAMRTASPVLKYVWFLITLRDPQWVDAQGMFSSVSLWLLVPFLILNPLFEETLVRGYLTTELTELRHSVFLGTVISILFQASYHLYYGIFGTLVVGCGFTIFALYYAKSRRLMPIILAHLMWDLTALLGAWHR
jgi:membrane protease YdiL (CAAX protease family)